MSLMYDTWSHSVCLYFHLQTLSSHSSDDRPPTGKLNTNSNKNWTQSYIYHLHQRCYRWYQQDTVHKGIYTPHIQRKVNFESRQGKLINQDRVRYGELGEVTSKAWDMAFHHQRKAKISHRFNLKSVATFLKHLWVQRLAYHVKSAIKKTAISSEK